MTTPPPTASAVTRRYLVLILAMLLAASTLTVLAAAPARASTETFNGITYSVDPSAPDAGATVTEYDRSAGTEVSIPDSIAVGGSNYTVTAIGYSAFSSAGLTSVTLPDTLTTIGSWAFFNNQLTSVALPDALTTIDVLAFAQNQLTSVKLPNAVTSIGHWSFATNQLTSVTLPNTLTTIDEFAFGQNPLTQVRFTGPMPTTIHASDQYFPSFGKAASLTVAFPARYLAQEGQQGYTTPEWQGYRTVPAFTLSFDARGGSTVDPVTVWPGEGLEFPPTPVRQGYTFTGWYTAPDSDIRFDPEVPLTGDVTVHAGWQPDSVPTTPLTPAGSSLSGGSIDGYLPAGYRS